MSVKMNFENIVVDNLPVNIQNMATYTINQLKPNTHTHNFFKYPCRFIPEIPRWGIKRYLNKQNNEIIFDPFAGSGTTLLEGIINGYSSYGTEIDGIAKLITKVKTTSLTINVLAQAKKEFSKVINDTTIQPTIPEINNLYHWYSKENAEILGKLHSNINLIEENDIKDFFMLCFISILKKVSFADDTSPKPYVSTRHRKTPPNVKTEFTFVFNKYFDIIQRYSQLSIKKKAKIVEGDALNIKFNEPINLVITSPPYINAFDYGRTLRLENLWLGLMTEKELLLNKKNYIGTESINLASEENNLKILEDYDFLKKYYYQVNNSDRKRSLIMKKFFENLRTNLIEIHRLLITGGHYMIVIGNSKIRGVEIPSSEIIEHIAHSVGYETDVKFSYNIINPYIRIPRSNNGGKISIDNVLVLRKV
jgi:DNA modification methylase